MKFTISPLGTQCEERYLELKQTLRKEYFAIVKYFICGVLVFFFARMAGYSFLYTLNKSYFLVCIILIVVDFYFFAQIAKCIGTISSHTSNFRTHFSFYLETKRKLKVS